MGAANKKQKAEERISKYQIDKAMSQQSNSKSYNKSIIFLGQSNSERQQPEIDQQVEEEAHNIRSYNQENSLPQPLQPIILEKKVVDLKHESDQTLREKIEIGKTPREKREAQIILHKRLEKRTKNRQQTPHDTLRKVYSDVLDNQALNNYLKAEHYFQDELDEDGIEEGLNFKYANDKVNPIRWDSNTVVLDVFRVIQDLTQYEANFQSVGEMNKFGDFKNQQYQGGENQANKKNPVSELVYKNPLIDKGAINFIGSAGLQGGKEGYTNQLLYDHNINSILHQPPIIQNLGPGKLILTMRVELKKLFRTSILKIPIGQSINRDTFLSQMQQWSGLPYHKRIIRPICFATLNEQTPLVFIEDMPFAHTLEDLVLERSFYYGFQYRYEISLKILSCAIQIGECLEHGHLNGMLHMNLHPGNILVPMCSDRDLQLGFYLTDFGDPLYLQEDTQWVDMHEKVFNRLLKIYPPNVLSMIKEVAASKTVEQRRDGLRKVKKFTNVLVDIYSFGVLILFMLTGSYDWSSTIEIQSIYEQKMQKAESIVDIQTLSVFRAILRRCFLISKNDVPFDKISDILPNLRTAKEYVERILRQNSIKFYEYDAIIKPMYEFFPGKRKEDLINKRLDHNCAEEFTISEKEIFAEKHRNSGMSLLVKKDNEDKDKKIVHHLLDAKKAVFNDEDVDLVLLNNQAVLAYIKQNYEQCTELMYKFYDIIETNPVSYFNYLLLCWEGGIYSDEYILTELGKMINPDSGYNFASYFYGIIYEAQNNWLPAKVNYELALTNASDSIITELRRRIDICRYFNDKYPDQFLFGHLETSDVQDIILSFNGKLAASFQRTSRIIVWNLQQQKILKEIEDKNATCMDASIKLDRIVVGLRSGLIVMFNLTFDGDYVVNVEEIELGFHVSTVLVIKISKDGQYGLSGGLDPYVALWNCSKKILLSKIDIQGQILKAGCINLNGEDFMFSTNSNFTVQVYHHHQNQKQISIIHQLKRHQAQVTALEISFDGMIGVSGGQDRLVLIWDLINGDCLREISTTSFVVKLALTSMGKFLAMNLLDGSVCIFETITGITWKTENLPGRHSGVAIIASNFMFEVGKESQEHKLIDILEKEKVRMQDEFAEARGFDDSDQLKKSKSGAQGKKSKLTQNASGPMHTVVEADPDDESDFRRTKLTATQKTFGKNSIQSQQDNLQRIQEEQYQDNEDVHNVNPLNEIALQDLFFENSIFKYYYFQNEEFTKNMDPVEVQNELLNINFERQREPYQNNSFLLKNSLEQIHAFSGLSSQEKAYQSFLILDERRERFDLNLYRQAKEEKKIRELYDRCKLVLCVAETRSGEDSEITKQGQVVGLRVQHINLPLLGVGPCQFITQSDVTRNIQVKMRVKAKEMREKAIVSFEQGAKEQAQYYFERMREAQPLYQNPSAVKYWAKLQEEHFKKGKLKNIFKIKMIPTKNIHNGPIEHIKFNKCEQNIVIMSRDYIVSTWYVDDWFMGTTFRAYHDLHSKYYLKSINENTIMEEFDVSVIAPNDSCNMLVCGLFNGGIQFWDLAKKELVIEIPSHLAEVTCLAFNSDCTILVSAGADYLINVWNAMSKSLLFEIREHLGSITYLDFIDEQNEEGQFEEFIVSIDIEGYMIHVSLDGFIQKKFSVERSSQHAIESMDVIFSAYEIEREIFLIRRNLNTSFYEFQKVKAGVEPYYAAFDYHTFPTIIKNRVDKRRQVDFLFVNQRGEFVCLGQKRDNQISFRNSSNLIQEKRLELKEQIFIVQCGSITPYMVLSTDKGISAWMIEWDIS